VDKILVGNKCDMISDKVSREERMEIERHRAHSRGLRVEKHRGQETESRDKEQRLEGSI
jgi:GTPase SAR1 family protein